MNLIKTILSSWKLLYILFTLASMFCFFVEVNSLKLKNDICKSEIEKKDQFIASIQKQSKDQQERVELARRNSEIDMNTSRLDANHILKLSVPKSCNAAIRWSIGQARDIG